MAVLTINWETLSAMPKLQTGPAPVVTSEASTPPADSEPAADAPKSYDKPYLIYIADPAGSSGFDTVEKVILDDDRVKIASHAFHMVKMSPEQATADPMLKDDGGKAVPRMVLITADGKSVKPIEGAQLKLGEVWGAMKATANKFYKQDLDVTVKALKDVLIEFDNVNKARKVLDDKEARAKDKPLSPADVKDIAAKRADLDKRQEKAEAKKASLFELKPRDAA